MKAVALPSALLGALVSALLLASAPASAQPPTAAPERAQSERAQSERARDERVQAERHGRPGGILPRTPVVLEREHLQQRLARLEELLEVALERSRGGQGRGQLRRALEEVDGLERLVAEAPEIRDGGRPPPGPRPLPPSPAVQPLDPQELRRLTAALERESFDDGKLRVLSEAASRQYFLVEHVAQLLPQFRFADAQLKAVRAVWPRVLDRQNGYELYGAFRFDSEKEQLRRILNG
jgi:hypothetical protein